MPTKRSRFLTAHRAVREAIESGSVIALIIGSSTPTSHELADLAARNGISIRRVSRRELASYHPDARDVVAELGEHRDEHSHASLSQAISSVARHDSALVLLLDHVTDPHNYGAVLRTADQFGVDFVIVPGKRAAPLSAVAIEASAGTAQFVSRVTVANLAGAVDELKKANFWVYAAEMGGAPAHRLTLSGRVALVMGNEGKGVSRLVGERSDERISIPRQGHADSLNVSVATGVLVYEIRRQQGWLDNVK
ncbi:MAG: 23S rRNA (guanosine(2251)-2'-O)-methyltransferase RlmB [Spirochaetales bacterium]